MKHLLAAVILMLLAAQGQAKVLIYKGTLKYVTLAPPAAFTVVNLYVLVDPDTAQLDIIEYFTVSGKKKQFKGNPVDIHITSAGASNGKTETAIIADSTSATFTDADNFSVTITDLLGVNATLMFNTGGGETNFPRMLTLPFHQISSSSGSGSIQVARGVVSYQTKLSETEHDAAPAKTLQQATDDVSAIVAAKGYMP